MHKFNIRVQNRQNFKGRDGFPTLNYIYDTSGVYIKHQPNYGYTYNSNCTLNNDVPDKPKYCNNSKTRLPLAGWRNKLKRCGVTNIIYKDNYSQRSEKGTCRSLQPLIRSGMQLNKNQYSTSFYEHNRNYLRNTYDKKLPVDNNKWLDINKTVPNTLNRNVLNNCPDKTPCSRTTYNKYSNPQYNKSSAVSASTRLEKLKLDAMMASSKIICDNNDTKCTGKIINNTNNNNKPLNNTICCINCGANPCVNGNCTFCNYSIKQRVKSYGGINNKSTPRLARYR